MSQFPSSGFFLRLFLTLNMFSTFLPFSCLSASTSPLTFLCHCSSGCEVQIRPRGALEKLTMAHRRHQRPGSSAVEGPKKCRLEGQGVLPLVPAAPATGWIHQVRQNVYICPHIDKEIVWHLGKYTYSLLCWEWDEKFNTTCLFNMKLQQPVS